MALKMNKKLLMGVSVLAATLGFSSAQADTTLEIRALDLDATITSYTSGTFADGGSFTGTLTITENSPADLQTVFLNGTSDITSTSSFVGTGFSLVLDFTSGSVTGGTLYIEVDSLDGSSTADIYSASVVSGSLFDNPGNGDLQIGDITVNGTFLDGDMDGEYADVSLAAFLPVNGSIGGRTDEIDLSGLRGATSAGVSTIVADVSVFAVVPTPTAALAAIPMLGIFGLRRRRQEG